MAETNKIKTDIIQYFDTLINEKADWIEPNLVNIKNAVLRILDEQPDTDVIEVKKGHWIRIKRPDKSDVFRCSVCGILVFDEAETCLRCKAKMDGGNAE